MDKLIGNENAYKTLAALVRGGRLSHALLIEGPGGCGKTTFAYEAAQAAMCSAPVERRPCGECRDCVKVEKRIHPDLIAFGGEGGSRSFHISTVRSLRQEAYVMANEAPCKVLLLRNTQEMSVQAQNALLRVLEEPPKNVVFLLTCENRLQMLETIRSRVQVIPLKPPSPEQCARHLLRLLPGADPARVENAASRAGGNVGAALDLLEREDADGGDRIAGILYHACIGEELEALAALAAYERDRQGLASLLASLSSALSGALLRTPEKGPLALLVKRAGRLRLLRILDIIEDTARAVSQNVSGALLSTSLCARIRSAMAQT